MLKLIGCTDATEWDSVVTSFENWDVYYLNAYAKSLEIHGDGKAFLIFYEKEGERLCYPVIQKDIAADAEFSSLLPQRSLYDWETPYGYGGPLSNVQHFSSVTQEDFKHELTLYCLDNHIVSQFIRYHSLLQNQSVLDEVVEHKILKDTIYMDLLQGDMIFKNMDAKNRNMVRKAQKAGVSVFCDKGEHLQEFIEIYNETMDRDGAQSYYYFEPEYYDILRGPLGKNTVFFYAKLNEKIVAASIFFYNKYFMHYHLSGNRTAFRKFAPTNLLLYEAACWGARRGLKQLHLGGGVNSGEDSLFNFKKQFNKKGRLPFYIGRMIFNLNVYRSLLILRNKSDLNFNYNNSFYIQYRNPR